MAIRVDGVLYDNLTSDPGTPEEGQVWYNSTDDRIKVHRNGQTVTLVDKPEFEVHSLSTSNPHSTTLEQARTAGSTLSGAINMNSNAINNVGGSVGTDAASRQYVVDQIKAKIQGLDWQESVLDKDLATPPGSPVTGDRYIVATGGTGAWATKDKQIAEWDGAAWVFSVPNEGFTTRVMDENKIYTYDGTNWGLWDAVVDHGSLLGLGDDDHTQYLLVSGTRAMSGALDMGTNAITNVGNVDGVDVSDHSARHDPGGTDELTTAAPGATSVATASAVGTAASFARSDHVHQSNTAPVSVTKAAAAIGTSGEPARADHKHDITTAAPGATGVGTLSGEGSATTLARSDHSHQANTAPVDVTKAAAAIGTSGEPARADHKHDISTAAPAAAGVGTTSGEGTATTLARSDHSHQANTAPVNVTKDTAAIGTSTEPARADHKHDITTAAAATITDSTNSEGSATSLARSDHGHAHGTRGGGTLHALVASTAAGFQPQSHRTATVAPTTGDDNTGGWAVGSYWVDVTADKAYICVDATTSSAVWIETTQSGSGLKTKAGRVAAGSFAGTPKKATVSFGAAMPSTSYGVTVTALTTNSKTFAPAIESKTTGGFTINLGSNSTTDLTEVAWHAVMDGETA